jgi:hypothetical protein
MPKGMREIALAAKKTGPTSYAGGGEDAVLTGHGAKRKGVTAPPLLDMRESRTEHSATGRGSLGVRFTNEIRRSAIQRSK